MDKTDNEIIRDFLNGDEQSFEFLMNRHIKSVYNFTYRLVPKNVDVDDIVSETFFKVWKNLNRFHEDQKFTTWLFTIARNTAFDALRKKRAFAFSDLKHDESDISIADTITNNEPLPPELMEKAENVKIVQELLEKIPLIYKEVLLLRYVNEFTFEDISIVLGKPLDTVKSQHRRALILARNLLRS